MKFKLLVLLLLSTITLFGKPAKVIRVIDGDTFVIETGEHVRVLGINAPEMKTFYGEPAKEHLLALIDGKTVDLEPDHISKNKDVYGRLLRYVYLDGIDIDKKMVSDGYAIAFLKYPFDKEEEYRKEEILAKAASLGIWKNDKEAAPAGSRANDNTGKMQQPVFTTTLIAALVIVIFILIMVIFNRRKK
ncbi:MAG TPA: thermonuclease family protein [Chitinophagaceae bacterium]|nr:thermonuclease family protein [Chitinophagaceae bacterium]